MFCQYVWKSKIVNVTIISAFHYWKSYLKWYCTPEKACNYFSTTTTSEDMAFKEPCKSKSRLDKNYVSFFLYYDVILDKLSKLEQILLVSGQVFCQSSWKLLQNEKDYSVTQKF